MKAVFICLIFILSFSAIGADYTPLEDTPIKIKEQVGKYLGKRGFKPLAAGRKIASLEINQVYFKNEKTYVLMKVGVSGRYPANEVVMSPQGYLIHTRLNTFPVAFYFQGISLNKVRYLIEGIRMLKFSWWRNFIQSFPELISTAYSQEACEEKGVIEKAAEDLFLHQVYTGLGKLEQKGIPSPKKLRSKKDWVAVKDRVDHVFKNISKEALQHVSSGDVTHAIKEIESKKIEDYLEN